MTPKEWFRHLCMLVGAFFRFIMHVLFVEPLENQREKSR